MSENVEKGIMINGVDVITCHNFIFEHHDGRAKRFNVCECGVQGVEYYNMMCSDNPDCYYKQLQHTTTQYNKVVEQNKSLQQELQNKNLETHLLQLSLDYFKLEDGDKIRKLEKTLKEIAEIAKTKIYTPVCFEDPNCPKNGGIGLDNDCEKYCPLIMLEKILEKIKEVENE